MTSYRERRLAKAERLRAWADGREAKAAAAHASAHQTLGIIAPGRRRRPPPSAHWPRGVSPERRRGRGSDRRPR